MRDETPYLYIDYQELNQETINKLCPLPCVDNLFNRLLGTAALSKFISIWAITHKSANQRYVNDNISLSVRSLRILSHALWVDKYPNDTLGPYELDF